MFNSPKKKLKINEFEYKAIDHKEKESTKENGYVNKNNVREIIDYQKNRKIWLYSKINSIYENLKIFKKTDDNEEAKKKNNKRSFEDISKNSKKDIKEIGNYRSCFGYISLLKSLLHIYRFYTTNEVKYFSSLYINEKDRIYKDDVLNDSKEYQEKELKNYMEKKYSTNKSTLQENSAYSNNFNDIFVDIINEKSGFFFLFNTIFFTNLKKYYYFVDIVNILNYIGNNKSFKNIDEKNKNILIYEQIALLVENSYDVLIYNKTNSNDNLKNKNSDKISHLKLTELRNKKSKDIEQIKTNLENLRKNKSYEELLYISMNECNKKIYHEFSKIPDIFNYISEISEYSKDEIVGSENQDQSVLNWGCKEITELCNDKNSSESVIYGDLKKNINSLNSNTLKSNNLSLSKDDNNIFTKRYKDVNEENHKVLENITDTSIIGNKHIDKNNNNKGNYIKKFLMNLFKLSNINNNTNYDNEINKNRNKVVDINENINLLEYSVKKENSEDSEMEGKYSSEKIDSTINNKDRTIFKEIKNNSNSDTKYKEEILPLNELTETKFCNDEIEQESYKNENEKLKKRYNISKSENNESTNSESVNVVSINNDLANKELENSNLENKNIINNELMKECFEKDISKNSKDGNIMKLVKLEELDGGKVINEIFNEEFNKDELNESEIKKSKSKDDEEVGDTSEFRIVHTLKIKAEKGDAEESREKELEESDDPIEIKDPNSIEVEEQDNKLDNNSTIENKLTEIELNEVEMNDNGLHNNKSNKNVSSESNINNVNNNQLNEEESKNNNIDGNPYNESESNEEVDNHLAYEDSENSNNSYGLGDNEFNKNHSDNNYSKTDEQNYDLKDYELDDKKVDEEQQKYSESSENELNEDDVNNIESDDNMSENNKSNESKSDNSTSKNNQSDDSERDEDELSDNDSDENKESNYNESDDKQSNGNKLDDDEYISDESDDKQSNENKLDDDEYISDESDDYSEKSEGSEDYKKKINLRKKEYDLNRMEGSDSSDNILSDNKISLSSEIDDEQIINFLKNSKKITDKKMYREYLKNLLTCDQACSRTNHTNEKKIFIKKVKKLCDLIKNKKFNDKYMNNWRKCQVHFKCSKLQRAYKIFLAIIFSINKEINKLKKELNGMTNFIFINSGIEKYLNENNISMIEKNKENNDLIDNYFNENNIINDFFFNKNCSKEEKQKKYISYVPLENYKILLLCLKDVFNESNLEEQLKNISYYIEFDENIPNYCNLFYNKFKINDKYLYHIQSLYHNSVPTVECINMFISCLNYNYSKIYKKKSLFKYELSNNYMSTLPYVYCCGIQVIKHVEFLKLKETCQKIIKNNKIYENFLNHLLSYIFDESYFIIPFFTTYGKFLIIIKTNKNKNSEAPIDSLKNNNSITYDVIINSFVFPNDSSFQAIIHFSHIFINCLKKFFKTRNSDENIPEISFENLLNIEKQQIIYNEIESSKNRNEIVINMFFLIESFFNNTKKIRVPKEFNQGLRFLYIIRLLEFFHEKN